MLYRSLVLGLVAACFVLTVRRDRVHVVRIHDPAPPARAQPPVFIHEPPIVIHDAAPAPRDAPATLIDVSSAVPADRLMSLVTLSPTERIAAYEDHHNYIDIQVHGLQGDRRVLMLKR
jgi:hypothetical protein